MFEAPNGVDRILGGSHQSTKRVPKFALVEEMDSGWSDWYGAGTTSHDSTIKLSSSASIKIVNPNTAGLAGMRKNITDGDWTRNAFRFFVRSDDWDTVAEASLLLSTSGLFTEYFTLNLKNFLVTPPNDEWIEINCTISDFENTTGSANWATVNDMIIRTSATAGNTPTVWADGFVRYPVTSRGCVSIVFDDGWDSQYTQAKLKMDQYNFPGTAYVIWDAVGDSGYMTQAQIEGLAAVGWDIAGHGGVNLTTMTQAEVESDLREMRDYLDTYGFRGADNYALPNGGYNDTVLKQIYKYFGTARSIDGLKQSRHLIPRRPSAVSVTNATSTATLQGYIDNALANGDWLIITFHKIVTTATEDTEYSIANFGTFIDYVASSGIDVLTVSDAIERGGSKDQRSLMLLAADGAPTTTAGCAAVAKVEAATNDIDYRVLDFDTTTEEHAFWNVLMPEDYDGGKVNAIFYWTNTAGLTTETVTWGIKARAYADDAAIDQASGTEVTVADTWLAQGDIHISPRTSLITIAGSPAAGQWVQFIVSRKTASDNMTGDARLLGVKLEYMTKN